MPHLGGLHGLMAAPPAALELGPPLPPGHVQVPGMPPGHQVHLPPDLAQDPDLVRDLLQDTTALMTMLVLEQCGLRDGDGRWYGCNPILDTTETLAEQYRAYLTASADDTPADDTGDGAPA